MTYVFEQHSTYIISSDAQQLDTVAIDSLFTTERTWRYKLAFYLSVERVQCRFTKRLPGFENLAYTEQLKRPKLQGLELRRLNMVLQDFIWLR